MRFFLGLALLVLALAAARADAPAPMLAQSVFAARGTQATILTITTFGRYSISVHSAQGVALQLVDRMAGPGDVEGSPGAADGRIDAFLERGEYKVRLIADARGTGTATLAVHGFTELQPAPVQLVENKPVIAALGDDEQRSWWLVVPARGVYNFEAGGRYLRELRLWKDGSWIVDAAPAAGVSAANPEQPLGLEQLSAPLEPGLYRLTAYGGPSQAWPSGSKAAPFMLRWGIPQLSDAGRTMHVASMLGSDRFLVPGTATDLRLVLDHAETASIAAQPFSDDASMFDQSQASVAAMDKTSRDPVADLALPGGNPNTPWLVTVSVKPGETYRLEALNESENGGVYTSAATGEPTSSSSTATLQGGGDTLLAVTLPGDPDDEIDPGFILVDNALNPRVVDAGAIDLDHQLPWRRRFNLLGPVQTYVFTSKNVDLKIDGAGVNAQFLVNRFLLYTPPNVVVPLPQASGGVWQLTPGFYLVSAMPLANGQGILTMSMYADGTPAPKADSPRVPAALFTNAALDPMNGDTLYSSLIGGNYGLRQLALPAELDQPLSFELSAGQSARFPITVPEDGQLVVADGDGTMLGFSLDGNPASGPALVHPGQYQFSITGPGPGVSEITVTDTPESLLAATPLPAIPTDQTAPPVLPALLPDVPNYIDLARGQSMTFALPVARDALYQFETTGLLETGGAIRTRTNPSLAAVEGNGIGRNFLLQPYLREGDYQLTVTAQGQTEGHAGVELLSTPLRDEGLLTPGLPARMTLEPGEAALYRFHIPAEGNYHILYPWVWGINSRCGWRMRMAGR